MAELSIRQVFRAHHGTTKVQESTFEVNVKVHGQLHGDFVNSLDDTILYSVLADEFKLLTDTYLDDIVGRATLENIAVYLLGRLQLPSLLSVCVTANDTSATVWRSEIDLKRFEYDLQFRRGVSFHLRGLFKKAIEQFKLSTKIEDAKHWNATGRCFRALGEPEQARAVYSEATRIAPHFGEAYRNRANIDLELGNAEQSITDFTIAVELMPESALAWNNRGFAYQELGSLDLAFHDHSKATELDPNYEEAWRDRATVEARLGRTEEASHHLALADKLIPFQDKIAIERAKMTAYPIGEQNSDAN